ncbi:hypothetical protein EKK58_03780 [Candidatus Dependentiae bacterium]|nr:MAG: hypothetical protein EKK58_03780 [Candidatus Dependentiae bacterium]
MYYFINYKMFPVLAKHKAIWWYTGTIFGLVCCYFIWLYAIDTSIKNAIIFYEKKLIELQAKKNSFTTKKNTISSLIEQKNALALDVKSRQKKVLLLWSSPEDIFSRYALTRSLIIDTVSVNKQHISKTIVKKSISLALQGQLHNILLFLEDIEKNKSFSLEHFSLHVESPTRVQIHCSYVIQKLKTLQL